MKRIGWVLAVSLVTGACARQSDVNRLELQIRRMRDETARADSARAVLFDQMFALQRRMLDSLSQQEKRLMGLRGDLRADLTEIQRQLVQIQELTGQTQGRLTELRGQIEARTVAQAAARASDTTGNASGMAGPPPDQLYELSLQQLRRGSPGTARLGFLRLLQDYPTHERAGDAQFYVAESWGNGSPDSAAAAYERVVSRFPNSPRIPTALYKLGQLAELKKDRVAARQYYQRLINGFPRSDEANLAREKLQALGR